MQPLILLHGALGAASQFQVLKELLAGDYSVHILDFSGHGASIAEPETYSIDLFAQDVILYMDEQRISQSYVFGYSMGGYVALYLARHFPERIISLATLATKMHWDEPTALRETGMQDVAKIKAKVPQLVLALQERHEGKNWKGVVGKTANMLLGMGADTPLKEEDFSQLAQPVLVMLGDRDKMVGLEETTAVYKKLMNGRMAMLPGTPHSYEQVNAALLAQILRYAFPVTDNRLKKPNN